MFSFDAKSVIQMLVDQNLSRSLGVTAINYPIFYSDGVQIKFRLCVDNSFTGSDSDTAIEYHSLPMFISMIFIGNVSVFYCVSNTTEYFQGKDKDPKNYTNSSNHSSCWRTDGFQFLTKLYFEMCKQVNKNVAPKILNAVESASQIRVKKVSVCWKHTGETNHKEIINFAEKQEIK